MDNPYLIDEVTTAKAPLFLIHGGGGTIFPYLRIYDIGRDVWGIFNPRVNDFNKWNGEFTDMAKTYASLIKEVALNMDIIIGGWSIGGCVALEIAYLLQDDDSLTVRGLIMIETIYPTLKVDASELQPPEIVFGGDTSEDIRKNLSGRMSEATHMLMRWRKSHCSQLKMENGGQQKGTTDCTKLPPTILLRSVEDMPLEWKTLGCGPREQLLGWQEYRTDFFQNVISVPGNHYTIFDEENMPRMLSALREACESVVRVVR